MKYPQSFIEEIKHRVRVSEVVGRAVPLKRAGREYHALCPFHKEKTPSFTVNDEKGFFHCFGCGAHGDVIGFVVDYEHVGYREAVEKLAGQAGLQVPTMTRAEVERENREQSLQQVIEAVAGWFEQQLEETQEGELARRYLHERGLNAETASRFRIGYAPADRDALTRAMKEKGISEAQLIETGCLIKVDDRAPYARFRRRLMFPIRDRKSRVIAFGGRVLPGDPNTDAPKYLNSPETALFHKGRQLFNLDVARRAAFESRQLIVCEGYMDVIALAQSGINYCVAPLGTAITAEQLQLCWQLVDEPTLCLDGDSAGLRAMGRASELALPLLVPGKTIRVALLPQGEDPDTLVRSIGRQAFDEVIASARPLAQVLWEQAMGNAAATPEARAAQEQRLMQMVAAIKQPTVQHYYKQYMRERLRAMEQAGRTPYNNRHSREGGNPARGAPFKKNWIPAFAGMTGFGNAPSVPLPPPVRNADASLLGPASNLLALALAWPPLLSDAAAEEIWLSAPMPAPWQLQAHALITELHIGNPALDAATLWQAVAEELPAEAKAQLSRALINLGMELAVDDTVRSARAVRLWGEVVNDVDRARLKAECAEAEGTMAREMTEENFQRFMALKAQLESIERERSRYYQQDPLPAANG
ncbi:MAG: DNA primase [Alphaproteobacteria bacterium]